MERASLANLRGNARRTASTLIRALLGTPEIVENLASIARRGQLPIRLDPQDLARLERPSGAAPMRSSDLIAAALIVSAAILADLSIIAAIGCALAALTFFFLARRPRS